MAAELTVLSTMADRPWMSDAVLGRACDAGPRRLDQNPAGIGILEPMLEDLQTYATQWHEPGCGSR
jgi:hypothetical protein